MHKVNWGIIGLGSIAKQFADGFIGLNNAELLGIASKDINKIDSFKTKFNLEKNNCFNDYESLIKEKNIDLVYIALPTFLHKEWIINCLINNKNVLVEKPATMNSKEMLEVKNYFENKGYFFEAFMYLYHPQINKVIDLINQGEIGELVSMKSCFGINILTKKNWFGFIKKKKINTKNRLFKKEMGGGAILDLGCYPVSFSTKIASLKSSLNIEDVTFSNKKNVFGSTGVEIDSNLNINFNNGFNSEISASFSKNLGKTTEIIGSSGVIIIQDTWTANEAKIILNKGEKDFIFDFNLNKNIYSYQIETLSDLILNQKPSNNQILDINQSLFNMQILDYWKV